MARPMLRPAPVTSATRPASSLSVLMLSPSQRRSARSTGPSNRRACRARARRSTRVARVQPPWRSIGRRTLSSMLGARQRLVRAAAQVRLALLDDAAVAQRRADVAGEGVGIGIVRIDHVAHLGGERAHGADRAPPRR